MRCPLCKDGAGAPNCKRCDGYGKVKITTCPQKCVSRAVWDAFDLADHAVNGAWPVSGGVLDQSVSFSHFLPHFRFLKSYCTHDAR